METPQLLLIIATGTASVSFVISWLSSSVSNGRASRYARFHASVSASNQAVTNSTSEQDLIKRICHAGTDKTGYLRISVINRFGYVVYDTDGNQQILDDILIGGLQTIFESANKDQPVILKKSLWDILTHRSSVAVVLMPIYSENEANLMLCAVGKANRFTDEQHIALLREFAGDIAFGIKAFELSKHKALATQRMYLIGQLFSDCKDGIAVTDINGFIIEANKSYCDMNKTSPSSLKNKIIYEFSDSSQRASIQRKLTIDGEWNGERVITNEQGKSYLAGIRITTLKHEALDTQLIVTMIDQTQQLEMKQKVHYLSNHDQLTGLPNKKNFQLKVQELISTHSDVTKKIAFFYIAINEFNYINEAIWDKNSEEIIKLLASKMVNHLHNNVIIGRMGDSEFLVSTRIDNVAHARAIAETLLGCMSVNWAVENIELQLTPTIGISIFPEHGSTFNELARSAQRVVKSLNSNRSKRIIFAEKDDNESTLYDIMKFESDLKKSIIRQELELHYQPQVDLKNNNIIGYEALIRWNNPNLGLVFPDRFIGIAESNGFIIEMGHWVIENACKQIQCWKANHKTKLKVAVNVSPVQFFDENLVDVIKHCISHYNIQPGELELEITESAIMTNEEHAIHILHEIKNLGILLSIDDFGVGHSSLAYLKKLPVHKVKIDRSFVADLPHDIHSATIVKAIMNIAVGLNMTVVAEGIENKEQELFMQELDCLHGQGLLYGMASKPH